jgi:ActR/RegA family two-component response regulator
MAEERRQYLRVIFEETIQVSTEEWSDPIATGLDLSLNGVRFHCEYPLSEGELVSIEFEPSFTLVGAAIWCWPIEWYYQAAVRFSDITVTDQEKLRNYIEKTTKRDYPDFVGEVTTEKDDTETEPEEKNIEVIITKEDSTSMDLQSEPSFSDAELHSQTYAGSQVALVTERDSPHNDMIMQYLSERTGFKMSLIDKQGNLWPMLRENALDLVLLNQSTSNEDEILGVIQRLGEEHPDISFIVFAGPISLDDRLHLLSLGAVDVITRPTHLSTIAQSILQTFYDNRTVAVSALEEELIDESLDLESDLDLMEEKF